MFIIVTYWIYQYAVVGKLLFLISLTELHLEFPSKKVT